MLAPALAFKWNYVTAGDLSQNADYANGHMYPGGYRPSNEISQITAAIRGSIANKPLVTTEAGYHNAMNTTNGHRPVPEDVAGVYLPRLLLEHYLRGEKRLYSYELIDEFADPGLTNPEANFGLLRRDWSPKPAFTAMKNTLALLDDPGPSFTPDRAAGPGRRLPRRREVRRHPEAQRSVRRAALARRLGLRPGPPAAPERDADQRDHGAGQDLEHQGLPPVLRCRRLSPRPRPARSRCRWTARSRRSRSTLPRRPPRTR